MTGRFDQVFNSLGGSHPTEARLTTAHVSLILCGLTHDPRSGLASVLANVDILEMQLKLFVKRIEVLGCCSDLAFGTKLYFRAGRALAPNRNRPGVLRDYERRFFHSSNFPQGQPMRYPCGFQTAPTTLGSSG